MKQTAVEWYEQEVSRLGLMMAGGSISLGEYVKLKQEAFVQAKAMEKDQTTAAYKVGKVEANLPTEKTTTGEQYYNETYGKDE